MIFLLSILLIFLVLVLITQYLDVNQLKLKLESSKSNLLTNPVTSKIQGFLFALFFFAYIFFFFIQIVVWGPLRLPETASIHGESYDFLMNLTLYIISAVFIALHILLAVFCFKYAYDPNRKALFFSHSNKLEFLWTLLPSLALAIIISIGLTKWNSTMSPEFNEETELIELYAKQFDWTARYPGKDNRLGRSHYKLIDSDNELGLDKEDKFAGDDKIVKGEFHIPVGKPVHFVFRSRDVIHSAYMPHFRAQMNCVPGMTTEFTFIPKYTTSQMKDITKNKDFEYVLLCNKICGAAHYNMQMKIVVDTPMEYQKWLGEQKLFAAN